ncbi:MAG: hypothetical protein DRI57_04185, partial [Deltaproteobacteria bacterium]
MIGGKEAKYNISGGYICLILLANMTTDKRLRRELSRTLKLMYPPIRCHISGGYPFQCSVELCRSLLANMTTDKRLRRELSRTVKLMYPFHPPIRCHISG